MIVIFSSPRSGSTWLGKIFDSHPDVFYLHEPEVVDRGLDLLPYWFETEPTAEQIAAGRIYLKRLLSVRSPRATGTPPNFRKRYRSGAAEALRQSLIYVAKGSERVGLRRYSERIRIPDLADRGNPATIVIKSVSSLGRVEVLIKAADGAMHPILLVRHPCAYVSSMLRGKKSGSMPALSSLGTLLSTRSAKSLGVSERRFSEGDYVEMLAWQWLLANSEAYPAIRAARGAIVIYDTLTNDTLAGVQKLFAQVGVSWAPETEAFLHRSAMSEGGYFSVFRDPVKAANRWRTELTDSVVERVRDIVARMPVGELFFPR